MKDEEFQLLEGVCTHEDEPDLIEHSLIIMMIGLGAVAAIPVLGRFLNAVFSHM